MTQARAVLGARAWDMVRLLADVRRSGGAIAARRGSTGRTGAAMLSQGAAATELTSVTRRSGPSLAATGSSSHGFAADGSG